MELAECYGHIILEDERVDMKCSYVEASLLNCLTTLTDFEGSGSTDPDTELTTVFISLPLDVTEAPPRSIQEGSEILNATLVTKTRPTQTPTSSIPETTTVQESSAIPPKVEPGNATVGPTPRLMPDLTNLYKRVLKPVTFLARATPPIKPSEIATFDKNHGGAVKLSLEPRRGQEPVGTVPSLHGNRQSGLKPKCPSWGDFRRLRSLRHKVYGNSAKPTGTSKCPVSSRRGDYA